MGSDAPLTAVAEDAAQRALGDFTTGCNCAESVLRAASAAVELPVDVLPRSSGFGWTGGIDESGCLCGALSAAVSLAGVVAEAEGGTEREQRARARELADEIRREFVERWGGTCCRIVRQGADYGTPECKANCEQVTAQTTTVAVSVLGRARQTRLRGLSAASRSAAALAVGVVGGLQIACVAAALGWPAAALAMPVLGLLAGGVWAAAVVLSPRLRRVLSRPGRAITAGVAALAASFALLGASRPGLALVGPGLASALGAPGVAAALQGLWVLVVIVFAAPVLFNLTRRKGSA